MLKSVEKSCNYDEHQQENDITSPKGENHMYAKDLRELYNNFLCRNLKIENQKKVKAFRKL